MGFITTRLWCVNFHAREEIRALISGGISNPTFTSPLPPLLIARMLDSVAPLRSEAAALAAEATELVDAAERAASRAAAADEAIVNLKKLYTAAMNDVERARVAGASVQGRLTRASELLGGLEGETGRWRAAAEGAPRAALALAPAAVIAAATLTFSCRFGGGARAAFAKSLREAVASTGLPLPPAEDLLTRLAPPDVRVRWGHAGLVRLERASPHFPKPHLFLRDA